MTIPGPDDPPTLPRATSAVRPYLLTGGRTGPLDATLHIEAQVMTTAAGLAEVVRHRYEHRAILVACARPMAVAEVAARLGLHLGVARVLIGDLIATGLLATRRLEPNQHRNAQLIERVIRGLQANR